MKRNGFIAALLALGFLAPATANALTLWPDPIIGVIHKDKPLAKSEKGGAPETQKTGKPALKPIATCVFENGCPCECQKGDECECPSGWGKKGTKTEKEGAAGKPAKKKGKPTAPPAQDRLPVGWQKQ